MKKKQNTKKPMILAAVGAGVGMLVAGLAGALKSMKDHAKAQHEVDKAEFAAARAEARADFAEAKAKGRSKAREQMMAEERDGRIAAAVARKAEAEARIKAAKN